MKKFKRIVVIDCSAGGLVRKTAPDGTRVIFVNSNDKIANRASSSGKFLNSSALIASRKKLVAPA